MSCQNLYFEILTPKAMMLGGGAFGKGIGHEGGALSNEISAIIKEIPPTSLVPFSTV